MPTDVKLVPYTGDDGDISLVTPTTVTPVNRALLPYPPANLSINGGGYLSRPATVAGDLVVTWAERNRQSQTASGVITKQDDPTIRAEAGTVYDVVVKIAGVTIRTAIKVSASFNYTAGQRIIDDADLTKIVTLEIRARRGPSGILGLSSLAQIVTTVMTGGAGVGGGSGILVAGRYEFATVTPFTSSGSATIVDPANVNDGDDTTFCDMQANGATADLAEVTASVMRGSSASAATLSVDFEIIQNDLFPLQPLAPAWYVTGYENVSLASGAASDGPVARQVVTQSVPGGVDLLEVTAAIFAQCKFSGATGAVKIRVYGIYLTTI